MSETQKKERSGGGSEKGSLIAFEGIDGSGKSTQIRLLAERLEREGRACHVTMEPTDSPVGSYIRQILTGQVKADGRVIAALFVADRLEHLVGGENGIVSVTERGINVITDRYYFSSYAYQSEDLPMDWLIMANGPARDILRPAATVFIDVDPDTAMERIRRGRTHTELFEKRSRLARVRERYLESFERLQDEETVIRIDGTRSQEEIAEEIWEKVSGILR